MRTNKKKPASPLRRLLRLLLLCALVCALLTFSINAYVISYAAPYIYTPKEAALHPTDCILVLGAGVRGSRPTPVLQDRINTGIELYEEGISGRLLMTGDHGRMEYDEVNAMKDMAIAQGVPSSHVFMDHAGFSTYESMVRAKEVFQVQSATIVTQEFHLHRAVFLARRLGLDAYGVRADKRTYANMHYSKAREYFARVKDAGYALLRPAPTYLGDAIPISGDGDATNDR